MHSSGLTDGLHQPVRACSLGMCMLFRLAEFLPYFRSQFAYVGPGCVGGEDATTTTKAAAADAADPSFQVTPHRFRLWASGRRHVRDGMAVTLQLRPRHDGLLKLWELLLPSEVRCGD